MDPETEKAIRQLNRYVTGPPKAAIGLFLSLGVGLAVFTIIVYVVGWLHRHVGGIF